MILATPTIDTLGIIATAVSVLWVLTLALVRYIIVQKDKQSEKVGNDIADIKEMIAFIQSNGASLKEQLNNNTQELKEVKNDLKDMNKTLLQVRLEQEGLKEWRVGADRRFDNISKEIEELKNKKP